MEASMAEFERIEKILNELKGNEATHGRAGVLQVNRADLQLNTDLSDLEKDLPEVLKSVVQRLRERTGGHRGERWPSKLFTIYSRPFARCRIAQLRARRCGPPVTPNETMVAERRAFPRHTESAPGVWGRPERTSRP